MGLLCIVGCHLGGGGHPGGAKWGAVVGHARIRVIHLLKTDYADH